MRRTILVFMLLVLSLSAAFGGDKATAELYTEYMGAGPSGKQGAFDVFYDSWFGAFSRKASRPEWDRAIAERLSSERRAGIVSRLLDRQEFSAFQEYCIELDAGAGLTGSSLRRSVAVSHLYYGLLEAKAPAADWRRVVASLSYAYSYFPSSATAEVLSKALESADLKVEAWRFDLYRYFDESKPNIFKLSMLRFRHMWIPDASDWKSEVRQAKLKVIEAIVRFSSYHDFPIFGSDLLEDESGNPAFMSFSDERSSLYSKKAVFAFFKTTCNYCEQELKALNSYYGRSQKNGLSPLSIIGIGQDSGLPAGILPPEAAANIDKLELYKRRLKLDFPLVKVLDDRMLAAYDVSFVPKLLLFQEDGSVATEMRLWNLDNIAGKLDWMLSAFQDETLSRLLQRVRDSVPPPYASASNARAYGDAAIPSDGKHELSLDIFYDPACSGCDELITKKIPDLAAKKGVIIRVNTLDILNVDNFNAMIQVLGSRNTSFKASPVVVLGPHLLQGFDEIERGLEPAIDSGDSSLTSPSRAAAAVIPTLALLPVLLAGLADGVNPCAFSTLLFLMSMLSISGRSRRQLVSVGLVYVSVVFISYFAIGIGLLAGVRALSGFPVMARLIKTLISAILLVLALLSVRDAVHDLRGRKGGMVLALSPRIRGRIHAIVRYGMRAHLVILGTALMAFLVSVFELACTGQVYFPIIAWLVNSGDSMRGMGFLAVYNIGFILPLLAVFGLAIAGVSLKAVSSWFSGHIWVAKLGLAFIFILFLILNLAL